MKISITKRPRVEITMFPLLEGKSGPEYTLIAKGLYKDNMFENMKYRQDMSNMADKLMLVITSEHRYFNNMDNSAYQLAPNANGEWKKCHGVYDGIVMSDITPDEKILIDDVLKTIGLSTF